MQGWRDGVAEEIVFVGVGGGEGADVAKETAFFEDGF